MRMHYVCPTHARMHGYRTAPCIPKAHIQHAIICCRWLRKKRFERNTQDKPLFSLVLNTHPGGKKIWMGLWGCLYASISFILSVTFFVDVFNFVSFILRRQLPPSAHTPHACMHVCMHHIRCRIDMGVADLRAGIT